jgi:FkbM family methyltransferase
MIKIQNVNYAGKEIGINIYDAYEHVSEEISRESMFYEIEFLQYIENNHSTQSGIIDIGASIGNHSLFFSEFLEYDTIHSFEPHPHNFELLKKNMDGKRAKLYQTALSEKKGEMVLYNSDSSNNGGFSLHHQPTSFVVYDKIDVTALDSYKLKNISMIKIDVEGHEEEMLKGAVETIKKNHPIVFIENLGYNWPELFEVDRLDSFFHNMGYIRKEENIVGSLMDLWVYSGINETNEI